MLTFRVLVCACGAQCRNCRFASRTAAENYFDEQANSFFNDKGVRLYLEYREDKEQWITLRETSGRRVKW